MQPTMQNSVLLEIIIHISFYITVRTSAEVLQIPQNGLGAKGTRINVTTLLDWPSTESFLSDFAKPSKPFIVRNAAKDWPAYNKWTDEYFLSCEEGKKEGVTVEQQKKENREIPVVDHSFHEFVSKYKKEDWYLVNGIPVFLRKDITMPSPFQCPQMADLLLEQMMWFSSGGTKSVLHFDAMDNIHCLIAGRKLFILIDPINKVNIDQPQGSYSSVDVDDVDYKKYPDLVNLEFHYANLTAGDCLYLPYHWYHQVRSSTGRSIGINMWWDYHTMMTQDFNDCTDVPRHLYKTMDQFEFHGTVKLIQNTESIKSHMLMLASQGGTPLTLERLLFIFLGEKEHRSGMGNKDKPIEELFQSIFTSLDQNADGKVAPTEVETLPKEGLAEIQKKLQEIHKLFEATEKEQADIYSTDDGQAAPTEWDDPQYDTYGDTVFVEDEDMEYVDFYPLEKDEL